MSILPTIVLSDLALVQGIVLFVVWFQSRNAQTAVGSIVHEVRAERTHRLALAIVVLAITVVTAVAVSRVAALILVGGLDALLLCWIAMESKDEVVGSNGARQGWNASKYSEVESWRLIGEHLRWKRRGQWFAAALPTAHHGAMREVLEAQAPGREDGFGR